MIPCIDNLQGILKYLNLDHSDNENLFELFITCLFWVYRIARWVYIYWYQLYNLFAIGSNLIVRMVMASLHTFCSHTNYTIQV